VTSGTGTASNFPQNKFPVALIERNPWMFHVTTGRPQRVFSSDQWSDYLIFRCYPAVRIFFDGRSDFFGPWRGQAYERLMTGNAGAAGILTRENVDVALLPKDWPLTSLLGADANWLMVDSDEQAILYRRTTSKSTLALMKSPVRADRSLE